MLLHLNEMVEMQVLSTGAVVVDLPGVRDANAARGAVAERYMKSCNAMWIVADITRAVDNRTAKVCLACLSCALLNDKLQPCLGRQCLTTPCSKLCGSGHDAHVPHNSGITVTAEGILLRLKI